MVCFFRCCYCLAAALMTVLCLLFVGGALFFLFPPVFAFSSCDCPRCVVFRPEFAVCCVLHFFLLLFVFMVFCVPFVSHVGKSVLGTGIVTVFLLVCVCCC